MADRQLPQQLLRALRNALCLEALAGRDLKRKRRAVAATGALMLAAVNSGWRQIEIANALGLRQQTVNARIRAARGRYGSIAPALLVDAPPDPPPHPLAVLSRPVEDREWIPVGEAADLAGVHPYTIRNWRWAGLLPNTARAGGHALLFLRADVLRVVRGPRYKRHGADYEAMLVQIRDAAV